MKRLASLAWLIFLAPAPLASAAPEGRPDHPKSIGLWSWHDPEDPNPGYEPWTAADVVGFLEKYPDAYVDLSWGDGKPPGLTTHVRLRELADEAKSIAARRGLDVGSRMCLSERPDVYTLLRRTAATCHPARGGGGCDWEGRMDGRLGEAETVVKTAGTVTDGDPSHLVDTGAAWTPEMYRHRLVVLRPGAGEERRRVTANDATTLSVDQPWSRPPEPGDPYEIRGSFDPDWVMKVPRSVHQSAMTRFWENGRTCGGAPCAPPSEPLDPFSASNRRGWEFWVDRPGIEALLTSSTVPALYGYAYDGSRAITITNPGHVWSDPYYRASSVVMDIRNREYRAWRIRYAMYRLAEFGFDPGESACMLITYKPGYYAYYDEQQHGPPTGRCATTGTNTWYGPVHICSDGSSLGGPLHPTQYRDGEFEAAISAYFRELLSALAAAGRGNTRIITGEAPQFRGRDWTTLAEDVRFHPKMREQQGGWIEPKLAELQAAADGDDTPADDAGPIAGGTGGAEAGPPADSGAGGDAGADPGTGSTSGTVGTTRGSTGATGGGAAGGAIGAPSDDAPTGGDDTPPASGVDFDEADAGGSGAGDTPTPRAAPRAASEGSSPASGTTSRGRTERRGFMASGGTGGASGTVEAPGAQ